MTTPAFRPTSLRWYGGAAATVVSATAVTMATQRWMGGSVSLFFFPAIIACAIYGGYGPALLATVLSTLSAAFVVAPPRSAISLGLDDGLRFIVLAAVGATISALSAGRRAAQDAERQSRLVIARQDREIAIREERIRVSRDLHDGVLQGLTGVRLELHDIAGAASLPGELHARLLATERALAIEQRELRRVIEGLNPKPAPSEDAGTLRGALGRRVGRLSVEWKTPISIQVIPSDLAVSSELEQAVLLMCQEATINALQHAHPSRVSISVAASDAELRLTIVDDGRGFPFTGRLEHDALVLRNIGPVTLRDRAASLQGRLAIESGSRGSRVEITLPRGSAVASGASAGYPGGL